MNFQKGEKVITDDGDEGVVLNWFRGAPFRNGKAHYVVQMKSGYYRLIPYDELRPVPRWERVEGKVRIVSNVSESSNKEASLVQDWLDSGMYHIERLVEDK